MQLVGLGQAASHVSEPAHAELLVLKLELAVLMSQLGRRCMLRTDLRAESNPD